MKKHLWIGTVVYLLLPAFTWGQATLENPPNGSKQSGISVISGWKCTGGTITLVFDGVYTFQAAYGNERNDTIGPPANCGDANNGFGLLFNWNLLGNGTHTVSARNNGVEFASATFTVTTFGEEFLSGAAGQCVVQNFPPSSGQSVTLQWQQSAQNFLITGVTGGGGGVPNVAGTYTASLMFQTEDCSFLSVPPDLPTSMSSTLSVSQSGTKLTAVSDSVTFTGTVGVNGDFLVLSPVTTRTISSCTIGISSGVSGNFFTGALTFVILSDRLSGSCAAVTVPCSVIYRGTAAAGAAAAVAQGAAQAQSEADAAIEDAMQAVKNKVRGQ